MFGVLHVLQSIEHVYNDDTCWNSAVNCSHIRSLHLMRVSMDMCANALAWWQLAVVSGTGTVPLLFRCGKSITTKFMTMNCSVCLLFFGGLQELYSEILSPLDAKKLPQDAGHRYRTFGGTFLILFETVFVFSMGFSTQWNLGCEAYKAAQDPWHWQICQISATFASRLEIHTSWKSVRPTSAAVAGNSVLNPEMPKMDFTIDWYFLTTSETSVLPNFLWIPNGNILDLVALLWCAFERLERSNEVDLAEEQCRFSTVFIGTLLSAIVIYLSDLWFCSFLSFWGMMEGAS